jgi:hypothetical protein
MKRASLRTFGIKFLTFKMYIFYKNVVCRSRGFTRRVISSEQKLLFRKFTLAVLPIGPQPVILQLYRI